MTTTDDPFILTDLPNGWWSVAWSKKQWIGIYTVASFKKLLELVFLEFGCYEVGFSLRPNTWGWGDSDSDSTKNDIVYIKATACLEENSIMRVAESYLYPNVVDAVCFPTQQEAETMLNWLEQKYMLKLLSKNYEDTKDN